MRGGATRAVLILASLAALAVLAKVGLSTSQAAAKGRPAPALPREVLVEPGRTLATLTASAGGRPALVVFWASWCGPCHQEAATLERFSRTAAGRGRVLAVDWNDSRGGAESFIRHYGWTFPVLRDGEGLIGDAYHLPGLPTTFVIDRHGRIRASLAGPQSETSLRAALARDAA